MTQIAINSNDLTLEVPEWVRDRRLFNVFELFATFTCQLRAFSIRFETLFDCFIML